MSGWGSSTSYLPMTFSVRISFQIELKINCDLLLLFKRIICSTYRQSPSAPHRNDRNFWMSYCSDLLKYNRGISGNRLGVIQGRILAKRTIETIPTDMIERIAAELNSEFHVDDNANADDDGFGDRNMVSLFVDCSFRINTINPRAENKKPKSRTIPRIE